MDPRSPEADEKHVTHSTDHPPDLIVLQAAGATLVLDCTGRRLPRVLYWGPAHDHLDQQDLTGLAAASVPGTASGQPDVVVPLSVLAEQSAGWLGTPGLTGHRTGRHFSTSFATEPARLEIAPTDRTVAQQVQVASTDAVAGLRLDLRIQMLTSGLVRMRAAVTNLDDDVFDLTTLDLNLPVPVEADEILDLTGRHLLERVPQRHAFTLGTHLRESRRARAHDASVVLAAGATGFDWRTGEARAVHVAWSGNTRCYAERDNTGSSILAGGELLLAGEVRLGSGQTYEGPWIYASLGDGLDDLATRFHGYLRSRPQHPRSARPVLLNVWEAVYFDHDLHKLRRLADVAASVGVERFVLDDGWFGARRDDTAGLGDWVVSEEVWPNGLDPLIDHVRALGMQFGLWFEPEMVNLDSDLVRAHPEWILAPSTRLPVPARQQYVLDLAHPDAYDHVRDQVLAVLTSHRIDYVKWDHNRDLVEGAHRSTDQAGVHEQTVALYRLLAEVRAANPTLEIESCAGGGGRIDLAILELAERVWASDCIDPLERQDIDAWTSLLLPPEMIGTHIASAVSHTTGRAHSLDFRAGTAFFGHLGIEWNLTEATPVELDSLRGWVRAHKAHRDLLHSGTVVHDDRPGGTHRLRGVVAADRSQAIYGVAALRTGVVNPPGRFRLPGLDPDARYRVTPMAPGAGVGGRTSDLMTTPPWWGESVTMTGALLGTAGVQVPGLHPEQMVLLRASRETADSGRCD